MSKDFARALRRNMTDAEGRLWHILRGRRFEKFKFRRQQPLGPYVADFVCLEQRLVIEIDGGQHSQRAESDAARTIWLEADGYRVLRFWNNQAISEEEAVLEVIARALNGENTPHPDPLPQGEREAKRR